MEKARFYGMERLKKTVCRSFHARQFYYWLPPVQLRSCFPDFFAVDCRQGRGAGKPVQTFTRYTFWTLIKFVCPGVPTGTPEAMTTVWPFAIHPAPRAPWTVLDSISSVLVVGSTSSG